jgi:hypothetical protein
MICIPARVPIEDLFRFIGAFPIRGAETRRKRGDLPGSSLKIEGERAQMIALLGWESGEAFWCFLEDTAVKGTTKVSGTTEPPGTTFLEKMGEFPS